MTPPLIAHKWWLFYRQATSKFKNPSLVTLNCHQDSVPSSVSISLIHHSEKEISLWYRESYRLPFSLTCCKFTTDSIGLSVCDALLSFFLDLSWFCSPFYCLVVFGLMSFLFFINITFMSILQLFVILCGPF